MKKGICIIFLTLVVVLLSSHVFAQTFYTANLTGAQEVPPVVSSASGTAALTLNPAGTALTYTITLVGLDLDGLQTPADPTDDVTAMHIHFAGAGANGAVRFGLISPNHDVDDLVINPAAGTLTGVWEPTDTVALTAADITNLNNGLFYFNVHTTTNPPGEIRGQIIAAPIAQPIARAVPTLTEWGVLVFMLFAGLLSVYYLKKKQTTA